MDLSSAVALVGGLMGIAGTIAAVIGFTFKRGGQEAVSQKTLSDLQKQITEFQTLLKDFTAAAERKHDSLDGKLENRIVEVDRKFKELNDRLESRGKEIDAKFAAYGAYERLFSERLSEERQFLIENYMKREEIFKIEGSVLKNQDKIVEHLSKLEEKIDHYIEQVSLQRSENRRAS